MDQPKKLSPAIAAIIVIVLIGIAATAVIVINNTNSSSNTETSDSTTSPTPTTSPSSNPDSASSTSNYKDGTYSATGSYSTPGGQESIELTVTLVGGVITSTSLVENAKSGEAEEYQADFASGYKPLVVGKKVDEVSLSRVAGSSLTSNGFNRALETIKSDAAV